MRRYLRGTPPLVALREVLLAALPAVLTIVLLLQATRPAYQALISGGTGWTPHAYQGLAQDVLEYQIGRLHGNLSAQQQKFRRDIALSSAINPGQFNELAQVERQGAARLSRIARYLEQDTLDSLELASKEAVALNSQAAQYSTVLHRRYVGTLQFLQRLLIGTAAVTGLLSMLLTARALIMWRAERHRHAQREARQREALQLASHELRRPLQSLLLASDLLRHADTPDRQQHLLSLIEESATQLANRADLTRLNDLYLDVTLHVESTDLRTVLWPFASPRVSVSVPLEPVPWMVDRNRLRQILENLIENALKYTDGPVEVTLCGAEGGPQIRIRDHGPGLGVEWLETVFLPYERGPRGPRDGQGLGLPLVRRYAGAHGGDVTLALAEGGGLIATVRLGEPSAVLTEPRPTTLLR
ncbi:HAMP domain-containing histidine kinase [Deinococcus sp. KSM4-11]|nr:HAMP domain-containing histidine kinase [Deinococcus sp. KSM4-11]